MTGRLRSLRQLQLHLRELRLRLGRRRGRLVSGKDPRVAALCCLVCPGGGQLYNGDTLKGVVMVVATVLLAVTVIGPLAIGAWSLLDAVQVARGQRPTW